MNQDIEELGLNSMREPVPGRSAGGRLSGLVRVTGAMIPHSKKPEINQLTIKLLIGLIALLLAPVTRLCAGHSINSISASYWEGGWAQSIFVGSLFAIAAFMSAYNGFWKWEMRLAKVAAIAALAVALYPCGCGDHPETIKHLHSVAASILFVILTCFCGFFYLRTLAKPGPQARRRARIYVVCGTLIVASIAVQAIDFVTDGSISKSFEALTYYGELTGLMAFGVSWLTASKVLPPLAEKSERLSLW